MTKLSWLILVITLTKAIAGVLLTAVNDPEGKPEDAGRIVGGIEAKRGQFPFVVGLWTRKSLRPFCGGVLIASNWMLTAAHCVNRRHFSKLVAVLGDHNVRETEMGEARMDICQVVTHPHYSSHKVNHDIGILQFCRHVELSGYIQPIGLAVPLFNLTDGRPTTVAGWGTQREGGRTARILRFVGVKIIGTETCKKSYPWINENQVCAGLAQGGRDSCQGDSGGPLWVTEDDTQDRILIGLVSSGTGCARPGYPGIYTSIEAHFSWILDTLAARPHE